MELLTKHPNLSIAEIAAMYGIKPTELRDEQIQFLRTKTKIKQLIHER
jgi:hypothetical protein